MGLHGKGLVFFTAASITDHFDGAIARRHNLVTDFGKLMDPVADKVLMAADVLSLPHSRARHSGLGGHRHHQPQVPHHAGLRLLASQSKGKILPADKMGKHKTVWQMVTVIYFLLLLALMEFEREGVIHSNLVTVVGRHAYRYGGGVRSLPSPWRSTLYSGGGYLWKNRTLLVTD